MCENAYGSSTRVSPDPCLLANGTRADLASEHALHKRIQQQLAVLERRIAEDKRASRLAQFGF